MNKMLFVSAIGRSGTKFLSNMLSHAEKVQVYHEPISMVVGDKRAYVDSFLYNLQSDKYITDIRGFYLKSMINATAPAKYIEINGYLRRHIKQLKALGIDIDFIHLVRDPKKVIRSMMSKKITILKQLQKARGVDMFGLCCRIWANENKLLREDISHFVRLEDIVSDWDIYKKDILDYAGLKQSRESWERAKNKKDNGTVQFTFPEYGNWTVDQKRTFSKVCIPEGTHYGYC